MKRAIPLFLILACLGCDLIQKVPDTFAAMSHTQRAAWLTTLYNTEYATYLAKAASPTLLSDLDKTLLRGKKDAMMVAWPLINVYCQLVRSGVVDEVKAQEAYTAMTSLLAVGGGTIGG